MKWISVPPKTVIKNGAPMVVPDCPFYYQVRRPQNADGTFDVLVEDK